MRAAVALHLFGCAVIDGEAMVAYGQSPAGVGWIGRDLIAYWIGTDLGRFRRPR